MEKQRQAVEAERQRIEAERRAKEEREAARKAEEAERERIKAEKEAAESRLNTKGLYHPKGIEINAFIEYYLKLRELYKKLLPLSVVAMTEML